MDFTDVKSPDPKKKEFSGSGHIMETCARVGQLTVEVYFFDVDERGRVCGIRTMSVET